MTTNGLTTYVQRMGLGERVRGSVLLVAVLAAMPLGWAWAASPAAEEELIKQGVENRKHQDDAAALDLFRKAYAIRQSPRAAAQMGLAEFALGRWVEAEQHVAGALAAPDTWTRKNGGVLQSALENVRKHLGSLQVLGLPAGAEIVIEGELRGKLPMSQPIRVRVGECRFDARAPGFAPLSRVVEISVGELTRETVRLSELSVAVRPLPSNVVPVAEVPPPLLTTRHKVPENPADGERGGSRLRTVGKILAGAGVLAAGGGLVFGEFAKSAGERDRSLPTYDPAKATAGRRYQALQWVGYGVGAALLAGGITTFVVGSGRHGGEPGTSVSFLPSVSPDDRGRVGGAGMIASVGVGP